MHFSNNIKFLRQRRNRTQDDVAVSLDMKRSTLSGYENDIAQPKLEILIAFSEYFNIAIDTLIKVNLSDLKESELSQLERGFDVYIKGSKLRVLTTTIDSENNENIELVNEKAKAGYKRGFADPEYIKVLPTFQLPFLSRDRKYRTFQITGDSMLPIPDGSYITAEFVQNWHHIKNDFPYVILTLDDGIVFKIVQNNISEKGSLHLISLNQEYEPYDIEVNQIREVWKFVNFISSQVPEGNTERDQLLRSVEELRKEVKAIQTKLNF